MSRSGITYKNSRSGERPPRMRSKWLAKQPLSTAHSCDNPPQAGVRDDLPISRVQARRKRSLAKARHYFLPRYCRISAPPTNSPLDCLLNGVALGRRYALADRLLPISRVQLRSFAKRSTIRWLAKARLRRSTGPTLRFGGSALPISQSVLIRSARLLRSGGC